MPATTGRAVSAAIHQRLRHALLSGEPLTYVQLAQQAGCTVRSVRNYLDRAEEIFGFSVQRNRSHGQEVTVQAQGLSAPPSTLLADTFGKALAQNFFAYSDTPAVQSPVVLAWPGQGPYGPVQTQLLEQWVRACQPPRRSLVRLHLLHDPQELTLWPLAVVLSAAQGVLLVGLTPEAENPEEVSLLELAWVREEPGCAQWLEGSEAGLPPMPLDDLVLSDLIDVPFCAHRSRFSQRASARVHVRFSPEFVPRFRYRWWHSSQQMLLRRDGSLDVRFGPVDLDAAASWACSLGKAAEVLGDKKLRKAVKKRNFVP